MHSSAREITRVSLHQSERLYRKRVWKVAFEPEG